MTQPQIPQKTQLMLQMLRQVAAETLERKRRLGHYAVVWRDGEVVALGGDDAPPDLRKVESFPSEAEPDDA